MGTSDHGAPEYSETHHARSNVDNPVYQSHGSAFRRRNRRSTGSNPASWKASESCEVGKGKTSKLSSDPIESSPRTRCVARFWEKHHASPREGSGKTAP